MLGLTAASVPLYDLFCRVTGYRRHAARSTAQAPAGAGAQTGDRAVQRRHRRRPALAVPAGAAQPDRAGGRGDAGLLRGGQPRRPARRRPRGLQRHAVQDRQLLRQGALLLLRGADAAAGRAGRDAGVVLRRPGHARATRTRSEVRQITLVLHLLHRSRGDGRAACARRAAARPAETIGRGHGSRRPVMSSTAVTHDEHGPRTGTGTASPTTPTISSTPAPGRWSAACRRCCSPAAA